jgi:hypothetical protein
MSPGPLELRIEEAGAAFRERDDAGRIRFSPAWADLAPLEREAAFDAHLRARMLERLVDPGGFSQTARSVLARSSELRQLGSRSGD